MKKVLEGLGIMLLMWAVLYAIGIVVTGEPRPWGWRYPEFMAAVMFISAAICLLYMSDQNENR